MNPAVYWSFADYVEGGRNPIADWYANDLSDDGRMQFDALLKNTGKIESHVQWSGFKFPKGELRKHRIWQLDFLADGRQYRVLGVFGSIRRQAVLLVGCYHKGKVYTPPDAFDTACKRAKALSEKRAATSERKIKFNI
ncbi:MAG: hypothetical protein ABR988_05610 [Terriglobales bacterium]|jgi:hypothetical protein